MRTAESRAAVLVANVRAVLDSLGSGGDPVLSERARRACGAAWEAGWYRCRAGGECAATPNPFAADR